MRVSEWKKQIVFAAFKLILAPGAMLVKFAPQGVRMFDTMPEDERTDALWFPLNRRSIGTVSGLIDSRAVSGSIGSTR